jgi:transcriptional regulator with XRE-family HTH domain
MIGKKIKSLIDSSGLKYLDVAKKLDITYQNLNRILNKESVETRYLFEIAKILNVPVISFFEDEPGGKFPAVDFEKLQKDLFDAKKRIKELEEQIEDKRQLNEFFTSKINDLLKAVMSYKWMYSDDPDFDVIFDRDDINRLCLELNYSKEKNEVINYILLHTKDIKQLNILNK